MTTAQRDAAAKGNNPTWTTPPARGERCPRCHQSKRPARCALCSPQLPQGGCATPWIANIGEGAVEHCPQVGCAPNGHAAGEFEHASWQQGRNDLPTVCVSITEPSRTEHARLPKGFAAVLRLQFQDYDSERAHPESAVLFTTAMAAQLARFARKHRGANIIVHCAAGVSRSGAIVEALLEAFSEYEDHGWPRHPNGHVKRLMKRALGLVPIGYVDESESGRQAAGDSLDRELGHDANSDALVPLK